MSDLPKFLSPVHMDSAGWISTLDAKGDPEGWGPGRRDEVLAERGQRPKGGVWPDGFGVVELEDIPRPEPLPTAYCWRSNKTGAADWVAESQGQGPNYALIATVTFDENDVATVTRHTS